METIFPAGPGYQGAFVVSFRKNPALSSQTQRTGTVLLKRSYAINPSTGVLTPQQSPVSIFINDQLDGSNQLLYETDLAAFKPEADLLVLGFAGVAGLYQAAVGGTTYLQRNLAVLGERDLFGWEPRTNDSFPARRQNQAGGYTTQAADYPPLWPVSPGEPKRDPLPGGAGDPRTPAFDNRFYNGYRRDAAQAAAQPFTYPASNAQIQIRRNAVSVYSFTLGAEEVSAHYFFYKGTGADEDCAWRRAAITMNLDTVVVEPDLNRLYVLWRGVWNFDEVPTDRYRRLLVEASG